LSADETAITQPVERTATLAGLFKLAVAKHYHKLAASCTTKFSSYNKLLCKPKEKFLPSEPNILVRYQEQNSMQRYMVINSLLFLSHNHDK